MDCLYTSKYGELYVEFMYSVELNITFSAMVKSYGFSGTHSIQHE